MEHAENQKENNAAGLNRERLHYSQAEMSRLLDLGLSHYAMIERGNRTLPESGIERLQVIEGVLDARAEDDEQQEDAFLKKEEGDSQSLLTEKLEELQDQLANYEKRVDTFKVKRKRLLTKWQSTQTLLKSGKCTAQETDFLNTHAAWCQEQLERYSAKRDAMQDWKLETLRFQEKYLKQQVLPEQ